MILEKDSSQKHLAEKTKEDKRNLPSTSSKISTSDFQLNKAGREKNTLFFDKY